MGRSQDGCKKFGLKRGPWTPEEDNKLLAYIEEHGLGSWRALPARAGLHRCGKSCRLRWMNYLRPDIKRGKFSLHEEQSIIQLHALLGNRWSAIASHLPKRTDNEIKNYWNTHLKKRLAKMGIDPSTHKAKIDTLSLSSSANGGDQSKSSSSASLSHMAQWESARLEAEARLARDSKLRLRAATSNPNATLVLPQLHNKSTSGHIGLESPTSTLNSYREESMVPPIMSVASGEEASWLQESSGILIRSVSYDRDLSSGFTEVLLDGTNEQNSIENAEDDGKSSNYWNSILIDMVNSSPPSTSPPLCSDSTYMFRAY